MTLPPAAVIGPADSAPAAASQSQAAAWNTSQAHLTDRNPPGPEKFIFSPVVENFSAKSWKLRGSCCSSVVARSSWGSISISPAMEDRRKTADSPQQYLDKVDRLLISWVTNHLGFSSCLPSVFCIPPNLGAAGRRGNKRFYKWILSKYSFLSPGCGSARLIIFKCNVAIFASEL